MDPASLFALAPYSIPVVLLIAGLVLVVLPFYREPAPEYSRWMWALGTLLSVAGLIVGLGLLIKPPPVPAAYRPVPTYIPVVNLPTPVGHVAPVISPASLTQAALTPPAPIRVTPGTPSVVTSTSLAGGTPFSTQVTSLVQVWAIDEDGVRVDVNALGVYNFVYLDDAYSLWPDTQFPDYKGWTTLVKFYFNRPVEWARTDAGLIGPMNESDFLGDGGYYIDRDDAIDITHGDRRAFRLNAGDYITLVVFDQKGKFGDNRGKVDIGITYGGP